MSNSSAAAIISGDRVRAQADIHRHARQAARGLADLGVGGGDAIALLLRNDFALFEATSAVRLIGAHAVPINWHAAPDEIAFILEDCGAKALVVHSDLMASVAADIGVPVFCVDTPAEISAAYGVDTPTMPDGIRLWEAWLASYPPLDAPAASASPAVIYTSGSTGRPKGVRRPPAPSSKRSDRALAVYGLDGAAPIVALINGPMYHAVPNAYGRLALQAGATIVLQPRFDPEDMLALIDRHGITHMHIVPAMMVRLLRLPDAVRSRYDLSSLRHVVHGAAPCPRTIKAAMLAWWGPVVHEYYGSTETGLLTSLSPVEALRKPGSVGRALPGIVLEVHDDEGRVLPPGQTGDVYAGSAAGRAFSYIGQDRADVTRGDLVTAGDIGWLDEDGCLFLRGRKRDLIHAGDRVVYPAEIEAAVLDLPGVGDCAVVGIPDDSSGESVCICVEPLGGSTLGIADLRAGLGEGLDVSDLPLAVEIVASLPREDSGKIFKQKLRAAYGGARSRRSPA